MGSLEQINMETSMKKKHLFTTLIFFLFSALIKFTYSQNYDSLYVVFMNSEGSDFVKLANIISEAQGDTANFTNKTPREDIFARVMKSMIFHYYDQQRFNDVVKYANQAVGIYGEMKDSMNMAGCYQTLGIAYHRLGMFDKAIDSYYKSSDILAAIGGDVSKRRSRMVFNNIGAIYLQFEDFNMAEKLYKQCIEMLNDMESDERNMLDLSNYLNNLSEIYGKQAESLEGNARKMKINEAISSAQKALELSYKYEDEPVKITQRLITLSVAYISNKEYSKAENLLAEAQKIAEKNNLEYLRAEIFGNHAMIKNNTGNHHQANYFYNTAIEIAENNKYNDLLKVITFAAYLANKEIDPTNALKYYEKYVSIKDSILNEESRRQINDFQVKYNMQEKELEIVRQNVEISRHKNLQFRYIAGLIGAGLLLILLIYIAVLRAKRNKELKEMNATKDKFFSIISHDLKNPAIAQRKVLQQLAENGNRYDAETLALYHSELLKSADYEVELIYNLLNWAQVQTGRMPFNPTTFDITEALHSEIAMIQNMANAKNIDLTVQLPDVAIVTGDRNMMITVIRNLLNNAVKFTEIGGHITLNITPRKDVEHNLPATYIITIADNGIGMTAEQLQNLFHIDKQQTKTDTLGGQSSGLGLIVCKELLEKHGSMLHVESIEGEGSRFWFEI
jgi:signal transduction histidine kinase